MILTDGAITDSDETADAIVKASSLAMSIIIIGVGNFDFEQMEALDGDASPLYSKKLDKYADRDIVQFVEFRKFKDNQAGLIKEVLRELPKQVTDYF